MKNKRFFIFILIILAHSLLSIYYPKLTGNATSTQVNYEKEEAILERVVDGDTIIYRIGNISQSCRLLGINTPEKNMPYSNESKAFLAQFVNKTLQLARDKTDTDKYQRKLRYIFYDDRLINLEIVERGLANAYMLDGLKYSDAFLRAEEQARKFGVGIWTKSQENCANCIILDNINTSIDTFILENICNFDCNLSGWFVKDAGRNTLYLASLAANSKQTFQSKKGVWADAGDEFFLFDKSGKLDLYYQY